MQTLDECIAVLERLSKNFNKYSILEKNHCISLIEHFFLNKKDNPELLTFNYANLLNINDLNTFILTLRNKSN
jgi:hypothetical protein